MANLKQIESRVSPPPQPGRDPALDGLRGVAVLLVFASTYGPFPGIGPASVEIAGGLAEVVSAGGVLFFVLSGFLLTASLWETLHSRHLPHPAHWLRNFFARRALRLFPLYYFLVALATLLALGRGARLTELSSIRLYAFFLENLPFLAAHAALQPSPLPLKHLWPVAVELQFACAWPLLLLAAANRRRAIALSLGLCAFSLLFTASVWGLPALASLARNHLFDEFPLTYASAFALGAVLALLRPTERWASLRRAFLPALVLGAGGCCAAEAMRWTGSDVDAVTFLLGLPSAAIAGAAILGLTLDAPRLHRALSSAFMVWIGRLSYGIFVFHVLILQPAGALTAHLLHRYNLAYFALRFAIGLLLTLLLALLFYELIEIPLLRLRHRFPFLRPVIHLS